MNNHISCFWKHYLVGSTHLVILSKFKKNWMRNGWVIVDSNLEKNRKWKWNLQEMNNYISCFWSYYLIDYIYVDTCSKFQIDLLRNVWDMHKRIFFIFNFKTGNEIEINRKWIFTFHDFEFNYLIGSTYVGICSKFQTSWMRNGWDIYF